VTSRHMRACVVITCAGTTPTSRARTLSTARSHLRKPVSVCAAYLVYTSSPSSPGIYSAVLAAQAGAAAYCAPGAIVRNMSAVATQILADHLLALQLINVANASLVRCFCPHGYFHR
jgi:hypothetical protein